MTITLSRSRFINSIVAFCGDKDLSKHWLISWTNVDFSLMGSSESNSIGPESLFSSDFKIILTRATLNAEISPAAQISIGHQIVNTTEVGAPDPPQIEVTPAPHISHGPVSYLISPKTNRNWIWIRTQDPYSSTSKPWYRKISRYVGATVFGVEMIVSFWNLTNDLKTINLYLTLSRLREVWPWDVLSLIEYRPRNWQLF